MTRPRTPADAGFTMLEVMVTIGIAGVLMAIAVGGFRGWTRSLDHEGTATEVQAVLRDAQQRAVTGGSSTCVRFRADGWTLLAGPCASNPTTVLTSRDLASSEVSIVVPFVDKAGTSTDGVTFYSRGTSSGGGVEVLREGSSRTWTVEVEGLTGRVSLS